MPRSRSRSVASNGFVKPRRVRHSSVTRSPQQVIDDYWDGFASKTPGKVTSIIPQTVFADKAARRIADKIKRGSQSASASYEEAAAQCRAKVAHIVKECRRVNQKYRDPHFDLDVDLNFGSRDCLDGLDNALPGGVQASKPKPNYEPQSVKRVADVFDKPEFFIDGPTANDVRQGHNGDCWLLAALCTLSNKPGLIERVCVAHDAAVGVYGFVFHRDGEWFSELIDDKLYLKSPDYDDSSLERNLLEDRVRANTQEQYRKVYQSNSGALYFAQCDNPNETWLPLLEKAYAKAHGDYTSIDGGLMGEGIEDLTGGVTSELYATDILDKEYFWNEELKKVNDTFLFGCSTGIWGRGRGERDGIVEGHAYSVMRAVEMDGQRLVLLKNPWGEHEWKGPWSDGSKEWTAEWIQKLNHKFGDDGSFWISYEDLLRKYQSFDRTRLFGPDWKIASTWTSMAVPWTYEYNETKFAFSLARDGPVVLVLSQLDERYFRGLEGQYVFQLSFRLHRIKADPLEPEPDSTESDNKEGGSERARTNSFASSMSTESELKPDDDADYVVRCQFGYRMMRSVSVELDLEAGQYVVLVRIKATRDDDKLPAEDIVRDSMETRREKLIRIGMAYDIAHSKGRVVETPAEKRARITAIERRKARSKARSKALFIKHIVDQREHIHAENKFSLKQKRKSRAKREEKTKKREERYQKRCQERDTLRKQQELTEKNIDEGENKRGSEQEKEANIGGEEVGAKVEKKSGDDVEEKVEKVEKVEKDEEKAGEKVEENIEKKAGEKVEENIEKKVEEKIEVKTDEGIERNVEEKAEEKEEEGKASKDGADKSVDGSSGADQTTDGGAPVITEADASLNLALRVREESNISLPDAAPTCSDGGPVVGLVETESQTPDDGPVAEELVDTITDTQNLEPNARIEAKDIHLSPVFATEPEAKAQASLAASTPSTGGKNTPAASVADGEPQAVAQNDIQVDVPSDSPGVVQKHPQDDIRDGAQNSVQAEVRAVMPNGMSKDLPYSGGRGRGHSHRAPYDDRNMPPHSFSPQLLGGFGHTQRNNVESETDLSSVSSLSDLSDGDIDYLFEDAQHGGSKHVHTLNLRRRFMQDDIGNDILHSGPHPGHHHQRQQPPAHADCHGKHCYQCPRAEVEDGPEPWNAIAVVGLRIYYQEVEGDKERIAAAEAKIEAEKAAKKKTEVPSKAKTKSAKAKPSKSTKMKSSKSKTSKPALKAPKKAKEAKEDKVNDVKDKDGDNKEPKDRDPKTDRAANGDHIVQLWVERPHPFMPAFSESESESESASEYDSDSEDDDAGSKADEAKDDGAIGQGAENTLDIDDTLKDSTLTRRRNERD